LTKTRLNEQQTSHFSSHNAVSIENWTKWRLYFNESDRKNEEDYEVIYGNSRAKVNMKSEVSFFFLSLDGTLIKFYYSKLVQEIL